MKSKLKTRTYQYGKDMLTLGATGLAVGVGSTLLEDETGAALGKAAGTLVGVGGTVLTAKYAFDTLTDLKTTNKKRRKLF